MDRRVCAEDTSDQNRAALGFVAVIVQPAAGVGGVIGERTVGQRRAALGVHGAAEGGVVNDPLTWDLLRERTVAIWLEASPIEKTINILKNKKTKFINDLEVFSYGKTITFADPDGNLIGLYEPPEKI